MSNPRFHRRCSLLVLFALLAACVEIPPFEDPVPSTTTDAGTFQDAGVADQQAPQLLTTAPASGSTRVPTDSAFLLTFSEPVQTASLQVSFSPPAALAAPIWEEGHTQVTIKPESSLAEDTTYTVTIQGVDLAGNSLGGVDSFSFTTTGTQPDTTPPSILSTTPTHGSIGIERKPTVKVTFSEPMDKASTEAAISFTTPSGFTPGEFSWNATSTEVSFSSNSEFAHGVSVAWRVANTARDTAGNTLSTDTSKNFRTIRLNTAIINFDPGTSGSLSAPSYFRQTNFYNNAWVGDDSGANIDRLFFGFQLDVLPEDLTRVISSRLKWPVSMIIGDPFSKFGALLLEPVDVGDIIELSFGDSNPATKADYNAVALAPAAVVSLSDKPLRGDFDVTAWTIQDWGNRNLRNKRTQYRLRFEAPNNADQVKDQVYSDSYDNPVLATLWVTYEYP
ncbi:Ig-like domain-containing protein [Corallococcus macrosporus]|uniref:Ig-like domain-containing protein n=1 Tax=Corallococcus macrosporus TaxID=35 RepID=A0ABS3D896_9BACT|nr:Ig-like domain-containing protein [Corallococcus macrosporus]MBN8227295.1 Ig-like domain-containing protein [Corallococcus macrosporus]